MRNHLGTSFKVWNRRPSWFWLVAGQHGNGGAIGAAATEAEAVREACSSIEEMAAQHPSSPDSRSATEASALVPLNQTYPCNAVLRVDGAVDERRSSAAVCAFGLHDEKSTSDLRSRRASAHPDNTSTAEMFAAFVWLETYRCT